MHTHGYEWIGIDLNGEYVGLDKNGKAVRAVINEGVDTNFLTILGKAENTIDLTSLSKTDERSIKESEYSTSGDTCIECGAYHDFDSEEEGETFDDLNGDIICVDCKLDND